MHRPCTLNNCAHCCCWPIPFYLLPVTSLLLCLCVIVILLFVLQCVCVCFAVVLYCCSYVCVLLCAVSVLGTKTN